MEIWGIKNPLIIFETSERTLRTFKSSFLCKTNQNWDIFMLQNRKTGFKPAEEWAIVNMKIEFGN